MRLAEAIELIRSDEINAGAPAIWADLGCGAGLFSQALATLLPAGSTVHAVDRIDQAVEQSMGNRTNIIFHRADFERDDLRLPALDGILMANALHYVADKKGLLEKLRDHFRGDGAFIVVEYDTMRSNPWVPHPIDYQHLKQLFTEAGYARAVRLADRPSLYGRAKIYAGFFGKQ